MLRPHYKKVLKNFLFMLLFSRISGGNRVLFTPVVSANFDFTCKHVIDL